MLGVGVTVNKSLSGVPIWGRTNDPLYCEITSADDVCKSARGQSRKRVDVRRGSAIAHKFIFGANMSKGLQASSFKLQACHDVKLSAHRVREIQGSWSHRNSFSAIGPPAHTPALFHSAGSAKRLSTERYKLETRSAMNCLQTLSYHANGQSGAWTRFGVYYRRT